MATFRLAFQDLMKDPILFRSFTGECRKFMLAPSRRFCQVARQQTPSISPAVRYLVDTHNIQDVSVIHASGPKNRLLKG